MLLIVQNFLLTLFIELLGVVCTAGILYLYWTAMAQKQK